VHVPPKQKKQWEKRCKELVDAVRALADPKFELPPKQEDRPLLICELFYDNVNATPEDKRVEKALRANKALGKRKRALSPPPSQPSAGGWP
jgi:alpha-ketoglutarate-dependent taurine dioxygenase